jgi:hypothetical protein
VPHDAIENGWTADKTHFDVFDEKQKKLAVAAIEATNADVIALQEVESLLALREFRNKFLKK